MTPRILKQKIENGDFIKEKRKSWIESGHLHLSSMNNNRIFDLDNTLTSILEHLGISENASTKVSIKYDGLKIVIVIPKIDDHSFTTTPMYRKMVRVPSILYKFTNRFQMRTDFEYTRIDVEKHVVIEFGDIFKPIVTIQPTLEKTFGDSNSDTQLIQTTDIPLEDSEQTSLNNLVTTYANCRGYRSKPQFRDKQNHAKYDWGLIDNDGVLREIIELWEGGEPKKDGFVFANFLAIPTSIECIWLVGSKNEEKAKSYRTQPIFDEIKTKIQILTIPRFEQKVERMKEMTPKYLKVI